VKLDTAPPRGMKDVLPPEVELLRPEQLGFLRSLTEVAQILEEHPLLGAVEVIAVPDERRGQALCACVVLDPKAEAGDPLARELRGYVHDSLGGLARPRTVAFVESFPAQLAPEVRRRALRLLCTANPAEWFTVTATQLAAAATATE